MSLIDRITFRTWYLPGCGAVPKKDWGGNDMPPMMYAESRDGYHWVKPKLGIVLYRGSRANNVVAWGANGTRRRGQAFWGPPSATPSQVFIDPNAESANDRFKTQGEFVIGVSSPAFTGYTRKCFVMLASPDGLNWHLYKGQNLTSAFEAATSPKSPHTVSCWVPGSIDTQTNILFDPASQRYHMYLRGRRGPAVGGGTWIAPPTLASARTAPIGASRRPTSPSCGARMYIHIKGSVGGCRDGAGRRCRGQRNALCEPQPLGRRAEDPAKRLLRLYALEGAGHGT